MEDLEFGNLEESEYDDTIKDLIYISSRTLPEKLILLKIKTISGNLHLEKIFYFEMITYSSSIGNINALKLFFKLSEKIREDDKEYNMEICNHAAKKAIKNNYTEVVLYLIENGANNFDTIMTVAAWNGNDSLIRFISYNKSDEMEMHHKNKLIYNQMLLFSAEKGHKSTSVLCIELGADNLECAAALAMKNDNAKIYEMIMDVLDDSA